MIVWLEESWGWMFWTWQSALFILGIFGMVAYLCVLSHYHPNVDRKGFLPIVTGRGDRFFIGLLSDLVILLLWLGIFDGNFLIVVAIILVIWFFSVFIWG
jgi:predicted small integral membrane protein